MQPTIFGIHSGPHARRPTGCLRWLRRPVTLSTSTVRSNRCSYFHDRSCVVDKPQNMLASQVRKPPFCCHIYSTTLVAIDVLVLIVLNIKQGGVPGGMKPGCCKSTMYGATWWCNDLAQRMHAVQNELETPLPDFIIPIFRLSEQLVKQRGQLSRVRRLC